MLRAVELGFVDDVSEVFEAFIREGGSQSPILIAKSVVNDPAPMWIEGRGFEPKVTAMV